MMSGTEPEDRPQFPIKPECDDCLGDHVDDEGCMECNAWRLYMKQLEARVRKLEEMNLEVEAQTSGSFFVEVRREGWYMGRMISSSSWSGSLDK